MSLAFEPEGLLVSFSRRAAMRRASVGLISAAVMAAGVRQAASAQEATPEQTMTASPDMTEGEALVPDLTGRSPLPLTGDRLTRFEVHAAVTLEELGIPGASIVVVQNGEIVFIQGFGIRELGQPEPVTPDTLLQIGSVTKSFSSLLAATLVDRGTLGWDTPLVDLLPEFAVENSELTPKLTIADAFSAASGLPRRDLEVILNGDEHTPETMIESIRHLPLTAPYGTTYQYCNQMVAAGGYAAAVADNGATDGLQASYEMALRTRVLDPIGMAGTTLSIDDVVASGDFAIPHGPDLEGEFQPLPLLDDTVWIQAIAPSGALWSSAREMARYLQTELGRGLTADGTRVVSAENLERTWQPGIEVPVPAGLPSELVAAGQHYGLGWALGTYGGHRLVWHSGGTLGFTSLATFLPDAGLGVVTLTNGSGLAPSLFTSSVQFQLLEVLFDLPAMFDWKLIPLLVANHESRLAVLESLGQLDVNAVPDYLGTYANPDLGPLMLMLLDEQLILTDGQIDIILRPLKDQVEMATVYLPVNPPLTGNPPLFSITLQHRDEQPEMVLTAQGDGDEGELVYTFVWEEAVSATPTS